MSDAVKDAAPHTPRAVRIMHEEATMKAITVILVVSLLLPNVLSAAPANDPQQQSLVLPKVDQDSGYSPRAKNVYFYTGIGALAAGGALVALGIDESNSDHITSKTAPPVLYFLGSTFLAASTVLWIFYFRKKRKEPAASVGLDLDKGKAVVQANYRF